jgi:hypothetical protein
MGGGRWGVGSVSSQVASDTEFRHRLPRVHVNDPCHFDTPPYYVKAKDRQAERLKTPPLAHTVDSRVATRRFPDRGARSTPTPHPVDRRDMARLSC